MPNISDAKNTSRQLEIIRLSQLSFDELLIEAEIDKGSAKKYRVTREELIKYIIA